MPSKIICCAAITLSGTIFKENGGDLKKNIQLLKTG